MKKAVLCIALGTISNAALAGTITKDPDLGGFYIGLDPDSGSFVYANSFVADTTGVVSNLGTWLLALDGAGTGGQIAFEIYSSVGGDAINGPDSTNVIASTGLMDIGGGTASLDFYDAAPVFSSVLTEGETYWFGASVVGAPGNVGVYRVGGHTQNSVYNDNGTFWFSNDSTGVFFDGQGLTPEMAFSVSIVPAPASLALLGLGGMCATRRRRG